LSPAVEWNLLQILLANSPAKALAGSLTEREVQTPSGRSTVWQATTVQRIRTRWSNQVGHFINLGYRACVSLSVRLMGP